MLSYCKLTAKLASFKIGKGDYKLTSDGIRQDYLDFFREKGHKVIPSSSLVPHDDPTLLLTSAGMVQIKPYFLGLAVPENPRLASCQKCFRTTDIDLVGDSKHLTFFEMLGNFSVGDYFKREAISWAWEFVTLRLKLSSKRLWVTVYLDDDEAFNYWRENGVPEERILRFGEEDNFWGPAGDSGPCGPCSEIHYDFGEDVGCGKPECNPGCDCGRFSEIWNLVFTQYNQDSDGKRAPLPKPNIDTGMGLERTLAATQGRPSVYDTELFLPLVQQISKLAGKCYGDSGEADRAIRITAEHSRSIAFLIADGILPANEGRGYVLRRILRRAFLFGRRLGLEKPFLSEVAEATVDKMGHVYSELVTNRKLIGEIIKTEEGRFITTLDVGLNLLDKLVDEAISRKRNWISGEEAFRLYDTYGFPVELTTEIAKERGLSIDLKGFEAEIERQRQRARESRKFSVTLSTAIGLGPKLETEFVGYELNNSKSKVLGLRIKTQPAVTAAKGDDVDIILNRTPFYGDMGGQVGDTGEIRCSKGKAIISNTIRGPLEAIIHQGRVVEGSISVGDEVEAEIDIERRLDIARNHTATHLLQAALRQILGSHVHQKGSLVAPERLRFDFSHLAVITKEQLINIQDWVNEKMRQNSPVKGKIIPYKQAIDGGAIALFEEKYGEVVRVVEIGAPPISAELCGGTHVESTGEVGIFLVVSEGSIGSGLRRIEAVTGRGALSLVENRFSALEDIAQDVGSSLAEVSSKVRAAVAELEAEHKRSLSLEKELSRRVAESLLGQTEQVMGITVLSARVPPLTMPVIREMGDLLRDRLKSAVVVLGTVYGDKPNFLAVVTPDLVARGFHAAEIVKQVAKITGGGGGGKAGLAQAGGRDKNKLDEALRTVKRVIQGT